MSDEFDSLLDSLRELFLGYTVFQSVTNLSRLGVFMQHHAASSLGLHVVAKYFATNIRTARSNGDTHAFPLCEGDIVRKQEILETTRASLRARIIFWNWVDEAGMQVPA